MQTSLPTSGIGRLKVGLGVLVGFIIVAYLIFATSYNGKVLPGVTVNGLKLSGMTRAEAQSALKQQAGEYANQELQVQYSKTTLRIPIRDLELAYSETALDKALAYGREGDLTGQLNQQLRSMLGRQTTVTGYTFNEAKLTPYVQDIDREVVSSVSNASLKFESGEVKITPSQPGRRLDRGLLVRAVEQQLSTMGDGMIEAPVYLVEATIDEDTLSGAKQQAGKLVSSPVTVTAGSVSRTIDQATILDWVNVIALGHRTDMALGPLGGFYPPLRQESVDLRVDPKRVEVFTAQMASQISKEPKNAQLSFSDGKVSVRVPGQDGVTLDVPKSATQIVKALDQSGTDRKVALEAKVVKPAVHEGNLDQLGIKEMISEGVSYFPGSAPERMQNVRTGQARYNGVVLKPGEVFSFGKILGDVGPQTGYAPSKVILGDRQELQYGGGLCQVSSTAFRAALNAGLPILERVNHSFAVSYYTEPYGVPGVDATIYYPQVDFKFKNDTPNYILIQTIMEGTTLKFQFFGTKTKEGKIRGPQFITGNSNPEIPSRTVFYRDVIVNGQVVKTDTFYTNYKSSKDFPNKPQFN